MPTKATTGSLKSTAGTGSSGSTAIREDSKVLNGPAYACRLPDDHTLITDSGNNRILEVDRRGHMVMTFATNKRSGSVADPLPWRAVRLENGHTLISDQFNHQVIEIDSQSNIVFTQGALATAGNGFNQLNSPCDAKVIGDYTGLTAPSLDSYCEWYEDPDPQDQDRLARPAQRAGRAGAASPS